MTHSLVLTAAGGSSRMEGTGKKEYLTVSESPKGRVSVLSASLFAFLDTGLFSLAIITIPNGDEQRVRSLLAEDARIAELTTRHQVSIVLTEGGVSRQDSVKKGLEAISLHASAGKQTPSTVLIHDAARPWVTGSIIRDVVTLVLEKGAAVPAIAVVDTQKEVDAAGRVVRHLERSRLAAVQTPQGFRFSELLDAHRKAALDGRTYTDDAEIWGHYAGEVYTCPGDRANKKITFKEDLQ